MKSINLFAGILITVATSAGFAQKGVTTEFDKSCNCNVVTNHFDNGKVSNVYHETLDGKKNGEEIVYYESGQIQYQRTWKMNKLDGTGTHFHQDGSKHYEEHYNNGKKTGAWKFYDFDGTLMQMITYTEGAENEADGTYDYFQAGVKYYTQIVKDGKLADEIVVNQEIYNQLKAEAEAERAAGKPTE